MLVVVIMHVGMDSTILAIPARHLLLGRIVRYVAIFSIFQGLYAFSCS